MIALEYFMVGIANDLQILINKSLMNSSGNGIKIYFGLQLGKNAVKPF